MIFLNKKNTLFFLITFINFILSNQEKPIVVNNEKNIKEIKKLDNENLIENYTPEKKSKKIRGYFGTKTSYYDKTGKPKLLNKDFKSLTFDELEHNRNIHLEKGNDKETLIRYTERMIALCKDPIRISKLRLEVADLYFSIDRFDRAGAFYSEFIKFYPGDDQIEKAYYRNIFSKFKQTLPSDKDQSLTRETLKLANEFVANDSFTNYGAQVKKIIKECEKKLLDYELNLFNFHLNKGSLNAAQREYEYIKKEFGDKSEYYKFVIQELEKQLKAAKDKKIYKPQYEITSNTKLFERFLSKKKKDQQADDFLSKYKERKTNIEDFKINKDKGFKKPEPKISDYVTSL